MHHWEPYIPRSPRLRVHRTSCCGEYELGSEGGQYFVLRRNGDGYDETGRGRQARAAELWLELADGHQHQDRTAP
jgi:hypothetical protein